MNDKQYLTYVESIKNSNVDWFTTHQDFQKHVESQLTEQFPNPLYLLDTDMAEEDYDLLQKIFPQHGYTKQYNMSSRYLAIITFYHYKGKRVGYIAMYEGDNTSYGFIIDKQDIEFWQKEFPHSPISTSMPTA